MNNYYETRRKFDAVRKVLENERVNYINDVIEVKMESLARNLELNESQIVTVRSAIEGIVAIIESI